MTLEQILDRDVPTIVSHARAFARMGIASQIAIFYKNEAVAGLSDSAPYREMEGWTNSGFVIQPGLPFPRYRQFISGIAARLPLFTGESHA